MDPVRIGIVGLGNMGSSHVRDFTASELVELTAVCDVDAERLASVGADLDLARFEKVEQMMDSGTIEAIMIATPHYDHTPIAISAMKRGIHVLCEKPVGVHVEDVQKMIDAYEAARAKFPGLQFGAMFQQRTHTFWQKIKEMIDSGQLGKLVRATWIITNWFRTQYYYDTGSWRATWKGEGGGVLLNQCPHNLDLYQWFFGVPQTVTGILELGKYHDIEVEDEVTAVFRHENGMIGHFITTTAEAPGTNRLEIAGEHGKLVYEDDKLFFDRNEISMFDELANSKQGFSRPNHAIEEVPLPEERGGRHVQVTEAFARAIREGTPLVAAAPEGIGSVALANGILMSHFTGKPVDLPLDAAAYAQMLQGLIKNSTFKKRDVAADGPADLKGSFA